MSHEYFEHKNKGNQQSFITIQDHTKSSLYPFNHLVFVLFLFVSFNLVFCFFFFRREERKRSLGTAPERAEGYFLVITLIGSKKNIVSV